jgi:catalase
MIELFTQCDAEYGRRVAEGLKGGTDDTQRGPIGTAHSHDAVLQAEEESMEAKLY